MLDWIRAYTEKYQTAIKMGACHASSKLSALWGSRFSFFFFAFWSCVIFVFIDSERDWVGERAEAELLTSVNKVLIKLS